jgi:hypothetical protein
VIIGAASVLRSFSLEEYNTQKSRDLGVTNPLVGGLSIGPKEQQTLGSGTLGFFVKIRNSYYILSNSHVMGNENNRMMQPSQEDGGDPSQDTIGTVTFSKLGDNVDFALAALDENFIPKKFEINSIGPVAQVNFLLSFLHSKVANASQGMEVRKYGRTTHLTEGSVSSTDWKGKDSHFFEINM